MSASNLSRRAPSQCQGAPPYLLSRAPGVAPLASPTPQRRPCLFKTMGPAHGILRASAAWLTRAGTGCFLRHHA